MDKKTFKEIKQFHKNNLFLIKEANKLLKNKLNKKLKKRKKEKKKKRIKDEKQKDYLIYLSSKEWEEKRLLCFKLKGNTCQKCASKKYLHIHHATYDNFKNENVEKELFVLCKNCHKLFHKKYLTHCIDNTLDFLKS